MRKYVAAFALVAVALAGCTRNGTSSGGSGNTGTGGGELSKLLAKAAEAKYKVTYQSGTDAPFTVAQDPPRFSYISGDSSTYVTKDGTAVSCSGTGSAATCTRMAGSGESVRQGLRLSTSYGSFATLFLTEIGKGFPGLADIKTTDKKIAGRDAACATIDSSTLGALGAAIKGSYTVCIDKATGIVLQAKSGNGSGSASDLRATEFGTPTDADLTPPATPSTVPGQ